MGGTKRLLLLRHAKSSWADRTLADHDRPLAARGRRAARLIGAHLRAQHTKLDLVLCSSAQRARQTLDLIAPAGQIQIESGLYGASADELLERIRRVGEDVEAVMLIGHNPAIHELAADLVAGASELGVAKFPTGALATLTLTGPWHALGPGQAELVALVKPRDLA